MHIHNIRQVQHTVATFFNNILEKNLNKQTKIAKICVKSTPNLGLKLKTH